MRFVCFDHGGTPALGLREGTGIRVLQGVDPWRAPEVFSDLRGAAERATGPLVERGTLTLLPPVPNPGKIVCIGLNYVDHAKEGGHPVPEYPAVFLRTRTSLSAPGAAMLLPPASDKFDYEAELAIVIGRRASRVSEAEALAHVAGYACFNDGSLRDYQKHSVTAGKNFPHTGPLGPWLVTADEIPDPAALTLETRVNGERRQHTGTGDMMLSVPELIEYISAFTPLSPGDVIATGTPEGVAHARKPPPWLVPGDVVEVEISGIGILRNPVVAEPA